MGNYLGFRGSPSPKESNKHPSPLNITKRHSEVLNVDPRSPSEGIVRTPIQINDPRWPSAGVIRTPIQFSSVEDASLCDLNNFGTFDSVLTEDDSIHRGDTVDKASALSDTEVTNNLKNGALKSNSNRRVRLSWLEKRIKHKSLNDSPGLFVRFRHKQNYEKCKTQKFNICGDSVSHSTDSAQ
ncbi:unnamed protein product [Heterobilharzia americana]|nr:unnamed protein product [Heterobilharzia americana]